MAINLFELMHELQFSAKQMKRSVKRKWANCLPEVPEVMKGSDYLILSAMKHIQEYLPNT